jgi:transcriptional regulator with XRE-family HTH domain
MKEQRDTAAFERYSQEHGRCLGIAVEELRTDKALTRSEVAKRAKVSVLWIRRLETNQLHTNYTIRRLDQVAHALGMELYDLYKRASEMMGPPPWLDRGGMKNDEISRNVPCW